MFPALIPGVGPQKVWPIVLYFVLIFGLTMLVIFLRSRGYALAWLPSVLLVVVKVLGLIAVALVISAVWPRKS